MTDKAKANVVKTLDRLIAFHSPLGNLSAPRVKPLIAKAKHLGVFEMLAISPREEPKAKPEPETKPETKHTHNKTETQTALLW